MQNNRHHEKHGAKDRERPAQVDGVERNRGPIRGADTIGREIKTCTKMRSRQRTPPTIDTIRTFMIIGSAFLRELLNYS